MEALLQLFIRSLLIFVAASCQWAVVSSNQDESLEDDPTLAKSFSFTLKQSCDDWVVFTWDSNKEGFPASFRPHVLSSCEITYMNQDSQVAKLVRVELHPSRRIIKLSYLNATSHYAASMTCNETLTSNAVHFITGFPCTSTEVNVFEARGLPLQSRNSTEVSWAAVDVVSADSRFAVTDVALGLFFAFCGAVIVACFAYYYWKKWRHRQRILRIFGQSHADPFLALQAPSDQPYSSF